MIHNGITLWQSACTEEVGVADGETIFRDTRLGSVAQSHGLKIFYGNIGGGYTGPLPPESPAGKQRAEVVKFLREWADAIEGGR